MSMWQRFNVVYPYAHKRKGVTLYVITAGGRIRQVTSDGSGWHYSGGNPRSYLRLAVKYTHWCRKDELMRTLPERPGVPQPKPKPPEPGEKTKATESPKSPEDPKRPTLGELKKTLPPEIQQLMNGLSVLVTTHHLSLSSSDEDSFECDAALKLVTAELVRNGASFDIITGVIDGTLRSELRVNRIPVLAWPGDAASISALMLTVIGQEHAKKNA